MNSKLPKVLHHICGKPMVAHVIPAAKAAGVERIVVVIGHGGEQVREAVGKGVEFIVQKEQLGSGHALLQARSILEGKASDLLVLNGDTPLVRPETLVKLIALRREKASAIAFLTSSHGPVDGLGRVFRDPKGEVQDIIEEADLPEGLGLLKEINAGGYCFDGSWLWPVLAQVSRSKSGEFYLTSLVSMAYRERRPAATLSVSDATEAMGVDTRQRLAEAEAAMRRRIRDRWMSAGVTLADPPTIYIDADASIGQDTIVQPNTFMLGKTAIGGDCVIGPGTMLSNAKIGDRCTVLASSIEDSRVESDVSIGPFSRVRGGAHLERGVHLGNYVEVKKSRLGRDMKSHHFSYLGDATVGKNVNIGAGSITCNYDGVSKLPTHIEDDVFVGCDTMLVAPVRLGKGSKTGAGAVVTRNVAPRTTVVGIPARPLEKKPSVKRASKVKGR
jgi:bifunctional UDP-N-acetylglucosamine pyrophosphorylase/glucosamine-1-phosphate N-acetyltransferase